MQFWRDTAAFKQSVEMRPKKKPYVFYDGPPFATGMPHYGHLLGSTSKDVIPRYWTMKGYRVERVWGWDCHGLPIENMIEKKLEIKGGKRGIEELGIQRFNDACRKEVMRLDSEWEKIIERLGRWVDFENNYKTMDTSFMESVWWGFKQLYDKNLVYEGRKVVLYCPRCATPLSNFEIAMDNSYQDVEDASLFVKFKLTHPTSKYSEYFLAWTTTPWTLPGNVALAVQPDAEYILVDLGNSEAGWVAKDMATKVFGGEAVNIISTRKGGDLTGLSYEPLFDYVTSNSKTAWTVLPAHFVSLEEGTGVVHTAAIFGEDDYALALEQKLPLVPTLDDQGKFLPFVKLVAGQFFKKAETSIMDDLERRGLVLKRETLLHSYPHCYRCNTPLYYNAVPAWFIDVQSLKPKLLEANADMNWFPEHLKTGRFGKGLETAPDWNISRSRYWGTPMPIWVATDNKGRLHRRVVGSISELQKWAVNTERVQHLSDIHREYIDDIELYVDDEKTLIGTRVPEVFDCWVESGSMPFASRHYPFENEAEFESAYPAQFVSEYIAQTRAWFYVMHVLSVGIFGNHAVDNTLTTGTILAEDGTKMSKSKNNYPDPMKLINQYGVDSLRLYLMSSPVMKAENLNFNEKEVSDIRKKVFVIWYNCLSFYKMTAGETPLDINLKPSSEHILDNWLVARLAQARQIVTESMDVYDVVKASRELMNVVTDISTWYVRRSRDRLKNDNLGEVRATYGWALHLLAQLFAPITPFFSEFIHHQLVDRSTSIHHTDWPELALTKDMTTLLSEMALARQVVERGLAARAESGIRVRQPLALLSVTNAKLSPYLTDVIAEEVNVKKIEWIPGDGDISVDLNTNITPELKAEGDARELIRTIQKLRKEHGLTFTDHASVTIPDWPASFQEEIERKTNVTLSQGPELSISRS